MSNPFQRALSETMTDNEFFLVQGYESIRFDWKVPDIISQSKIGTYRLFLSPIFSFGNSKWTLCIFRVKSLVFFRIEHTIRREPMLTDAYRFRYKFNIKKMDGTVMKLPCNYEENFFAGVVKADDILDGKIEQSLLNTMTITGFLERKIMFSVDHYILTKPPTFKYINLSAVEKLLKIGDSCKCIPSDSCDVTIKVKDKTFYANKAALAAHSTVFQAMFQHEWLENKTSVITISDCEPETIKDLLWYLHHGELELGDSFDRAVNLYCVSNKYNVLDVKYFCVEYLGECLTVDDICDVIELADFYEDKRLLFVTQKFFSKKISKIVVTTKWEKLLKNNSSLANKFITQMPSQNNIKNRLRKNKRLKC